MVITRRDDSGVTLTELVVVLALLGVVIGAVFGVVQVLSESAGSTTTNSTATNDLSYTMELLAKEIMGGRLLYASDQRIVFLSRMSDGSQQVESVYAAPSSTPSATTGQLVWERWSSNASGTAPAGVTHTIWVMSEANANLTASPQIPLFTYFKSADDASVMSTVPPEKVAGTDASLTAFMGNLPGGYATAMIGRVRLRVAARFADGIRDNSRDIALRIR